MSEWRDLAVMGIKAENLMSAAAGGFLGIYFLSPIRAAQAVFHFSAAVTASVVFSPWLYENASVAATYLAKHGFVVHFESSASFGAIHAASAIILPGLLRQLFTWSKGKNQTTIPVEVRDK